MDRRVELFVTVLLAGSCLLVAGQQLLARLQPRFTPLTIEQPYLRVSVSGHVVRPGVYELDWGALVGDLIAAAGGFSAGAATELIAAARPLGQGDSVHVPHLQAADGGDRISINSADTWTLQRLPGVGPAMAERIIRGRPYPTVEGLLDVAGIGPVIFARLVPLVAP